MNLYVLIAQAICDHGVQGVFTSERLALKRAAEIWPQTDGHHNFRIDVVELNAAITPDFTLGCWYAGVERLTTEPLPHIELVKRETVT